MRKNHQVRQLLSLWGAAPLYLREWQNDLETFGQLTKQMHTLLAAQTQRRMPQLLEANSAAQTRTQLCRMEAYYLKTAQATQLALQDVLRVRRFVDTLLQMLRPNEYETVAQYYKHGKGWEAIARKLGVSQRQAQRILNGVLEELDLLLDIQALDQLCKSKQIRSYLDLQVRNSKPPQEAAGVSSGAAQPDAG